MPSSIVPFAKPFGQVFGEVCGLRTGHAACVIRQLRSQMVVVDGHLKSLPWALRIFREVGLDVINEGEYTKDGDWLRYVETRLGGFEQPPVASQTPASWH